MRYIQKLLDKKNILHLTIFVCLAADLFFFYSNGLLREHFNNSAYINFINDFPKSIASTRVEPLFVILSVILAKLIDSPIFSIIILKILLIIGQLYAFYKVTNLFLKNSYLTALAVLFLNFSFAFFSLTDNLLRNSLGNLLFLISIYFIFKIFSSKTIKLADIIFASIFGGLVIYAHILPAIILDFGLLGIIFFIILFEFVKKYGYFSAVTKRFYSRNLPTKASLCATFSILIIQLPYIIRMFIARAGISDYDQIEPIKILLPFFESLKIFLATTLRVIFEYRLTGFSVFFIFLIFLSVFFQLKKLRINSPQFPLLVFWVVTYACSKSDLLFGIEVIPYRFSLMLIFPSIILIILLLNELLERINNSEGKLFFSLMLFISFLAINISITAEASLLKNYNNNIRKNETLKHIYAQTFPEAEKNVFLINGDSFQDFDSISTYLRNNNAFSTSDQGPGISFFENNKITYILFDRNRIQQKGTDLGSVINTNLDFFENSPYFENLTEFIEGGGINLTVFKFIPTGKSKKQTTLYRFDCLTNQDCIRDFSDTLASFDSQINKWNVEINAKDNTYVTEYVWLNDGNNIEINYAESDLRNNILRRNSVVALANIPARQSIVPTVNIHIKSGLILLSSQNIDINYVNLEKFSIDKLTVSGVLRDNYIKYAVLTREGFRISISLLFFIVLIIIYIVLILYRKNKLSKNNLFDFTSKTHAIIILGLAFFLIMDMLVGNMLFLEIYKKIIGA